MTGPFKNDSIFTFKELDLKIVQLEVFKKEIKKFPAETREDILSLVGKFTEGEQLTSKQFKTFKIDRETKIQEFRVKDSKGNWRVISCIVLSNILVLVYAFHKKSQALLEKDKNTVRKRIKRIKL